MPVWPSVVVKSIYRMHIVGDEKLDDPLEWEDDEEGVVWDLD